MFRLRKPTRSRKITSSSLHDQFHLFCDIWIYLYHTFLCDEPPMLALVSTHFVKLLQYIDFRVLLVPDIRSHAMPLSCSRLEVQTATQFKFKHLPAHIHYLKIHNLNVSCTTLPDHIHTIKCDTFVYDQAHTVQHIYARNFVYHANVNILQLKSLITIYAIDVAYLQHSNIEFLDVDCHVQNICLAPCKYLTLRNHDDETFVIKREHIHNNVTHLRLIGAFKIHKSIKRLRIYYGAHESHDSRANFAFYRF